MALLFLTKLFHIIVYALYPVISYCIKQAIRSILQFLFCKEHCLTKISFCDFTQYDIQPGGRRSIMENLRFEIRDCAATAMEFLNGLVQPTKGLIYDRGCRILCGNGQFHLLDDMSGSGKCRCDRKAKRFLSGNLSHLIHIPKDIVNGAWLCGYDCSDGSTTPDRGCR